MIIALPLMVQNLITSSVSFLDTLMIGQVGEVELAAVGIANQMFFLINLFFFGLASGSSILLSQFYGSGDYKNIKKTLSFSVSICLAGAFIVSAVSYFFPSFIMGFFSNDPLVINSGAVYLKIVAVSYIFSALSSALSIGFRTISKATLPMAVTLVSLSINAIGNYLLIFGVGIFPKLGVAGAAAATVMARLVEVLFLSYFTWMKDTGSVFAFSFKKDLKLNKEFIRLYARTCVPVLLNEVLWSVGMTLYKVAYGTLGTQTVATVYIVESINNFFFIATLSIGNGATILLGTTLGSGDRNRAVSWAKNLIFLSFLIGLVMGVMEILFSPFFASWFNVDENVYRLSISALRVKGLQLPFMSINMMTIVGILRAGGDTKYAAFAELFAVYAIGVPVTLISANVFHLSLVVIYILLSLEELTKLVLGLPRVISRKWANTLTAESVNTN